MQCIQHTLLVSVSCMSRLNCGRSHTFGHMLGCEVVDFELFESTGSLWDIVIPAVSIQELNINFKCSC
jgi:hypothetical protein